MLKICPYFNYKVDFELQKYCFIFNSNAPLDDASTKYILYVMLSYQAY